MSTEALSAKNVKYDLPDFVLAPGEEQVLAEDLVDGLPRKPQIIYGELLLRSG